jgi:anti-sigma regulatory factor (Ser/Thr protein kinase)
MPSSASHHSRKSRSPNAGPKARRRPASGVIPTRLDELETALLGTLSHGRSSSWRPEGESVALQTEQIRGRDEHAVHFYADERDLAATVGGYLVRGVRAGEVSIVIATEAHRRAFETEMASAGIDVKRARRDASYVSLDASAMLARFTASGRLDPDAFRAVIGRVILTAVRSGRPVQAYGEMVALLWEAGDVLGAIELEGLWNDLRDEMRFSLLCAYRSDLVSGDEHAGAFAHVCRLHTRVLGANQAQLGANQAQLGANQAQLGATEAGFEAALGAPAAARRFVRRALAERGHHETRVGDDAQLVVSELTTNAVIHARTPFSVSVRVGPAAIRLAVTDNSLALPQVKDVPPTAVSGRGLRLIDAIADSWGVEPTANGKAVWAELPVR